MRSFRTRVLCEARWRENPRRAADSSRGFSAAVAHVALVIQTLKRTETMRKFEELSSFILPRRPVRIGLFVSRIGKTFIGPPASVSTDRASVRRLYRAG